MVQCICVHISHPFFYIESVTIKVLQNFKLFNNHNYNLTPIIGVVTSVCNFYEDAEMEKHILKKLNFSRKVNCHKNSVPCYLTLFFNS
jgi:hypothetical protein